MRKQFEEFREGLLRPSRASLAGILIVAVAWFVVAAAAVTPEFVAVRGAPVLERLRDGGRITCSALRLRSSKERPPTVILIGASGFRRALTRPEDVAARLSARVGRQIEVVDLTVGGMTVWEAASLMDCVPSGFHGVVVISFGPTMLSYSPEDLAKRAGKIRFGLDTEAHDEELRRAGFEPPRRTGIYFIDHLDFLLAHRATWPHLLRKPSTRLGRINPWRPVRHGARSDRHRARIRARLDDYEVTREPCLATLGRAFDRLRERGVEEIVYVTPPRNPAHEGTTYPIHILEDLVPRVRGFGEEHDLTLLVPGPETTLRAEDFFDECHLQDLEAVKRYTSLFVERLAPSIHRVLNGESR